uniref:SprT-like domain-containing protein n=2 Tax=Rhodosorus marinus TaxID=101924 RepID=A0A7S3ENU7_9RHOD|mmetsp:Transcript_5655/g.23955  ORF Transcript_5655/g.23955 Transcript_5655/m.23955 type:complete len:313 (+) Transcript_5655:269-1207(+)
MGLFGSEVFEDQDSIASGELRGKGGEQRVGFLSVGELRTMALARARARKWCDLTFRTLTSLSGVPLAKMPAVEPLGGMAKEMRKLSVVEMRQKGMEKNVHITNRDSLVSALAGAQIPASENTRIPIVPGRIPSTPSSKTSRRGKKSIRKLTKTRSSPAESGDGVRELTEKLKTGLDLNVAEDKQDQENPEIIMCRNWLSWYFTCEQQQFRKRRDEFSTVLFTIFDYNVTGSNLGDRVSLEWNKRFNTTAGMTHFRMKKISKDRYAGIVLSTKVLDSPLKLYRTLAHEMCHAAQWVIDGKPKPPHGRPRTRRR